MDLDVLAPLDPHPWTGRKEVLLRRAAAVCDQTSAASRIDQLAALNPEIACRLLQALPSDAHRRFVLRWMPLGTLCALPWSNLQVDLAIKGSAIHADYLRNLVAVDRQVAKRMLVWSGTRRAWSQSLIEEVWPGVAASATLRRACMRALLTVACHATGASLLPWLDALRYAVLGSVYDDCVRRARGYGKSKHVLFLE